MSLSYVPFLLRERERERKKKKKKRTGSDLGNS
jgi:hypothetical protein